MRKLGHFFKCVLEKTKATKKQLKRSYSKKSKKSKSVMLESPCRLLFYVFKCEES